MGRKALFRLPLRLSCGPLWDFSDSLGRFILGSPYAGSWIAPVRGAQKRPIARSYA